MQPEKDACLAESVSIRTTIPQDFRSLSKVSARSSRAFGICYLALAIGYLGGGYAPLCPSVVEMNSHC